MDTEFIRLILRSFILLAALFFSCAKVGRMLAAVYNHDSFDAEEWAIPCVLWTGLFILSQ